MKKENKQHIETLNEISEIMGRVKTLNEAVMFEDEMEPSFEDDDEYEGVENEVEPEMDMCADKECDIDEMNDIDCIREIALKGMLKYVKQSNSPEYETLKKIFQFCDKVNNDKPEEFEKK